MEKFVAKCPDCGKIDYQINEKDLLPFQKNIGGNPRGYCTDCKKDFESDLQ